MDIAIIWNPATFSGDWGVTSGDLVTDPGGLETAVLLSLFTDRQAPADYEPPPGEVWERRGCWIDTYEPSPIGSWLWLLNRVKISNRQALANQAQDYCSEALQWLVDAGVVATVDVIVGWLSGNTLGIQVTIAPPNSPPQTFNYDWAWQGTGS